MRYREWLECDFTVLDGHVFGVSGIGCVIICRKLPSLIFQSTGLTDAATTRTRTSFDVMLGLGASSNAKMSALP